MFLSERLVLEVFSVTVCWRELVLDLDMFRWRWIFNVEQDKLGGRTTRNAIEDIQPQRRFVVSPIVNQIDVLQRDWTMKVPLALDIGFNRGVEESRPAYGLREDAKVDEATLLIVFFHHLIVDGLTSRYAVKE